MNLFSKNFNPDSFLSIALYLDRVVVVIFTYSQITSHQSWDRCRMYLTNSSLEKFIFFEMIFIINVKLIGSNEEAFTKLF
jgi:hypothetical protein